MQKIKSIKWMAILLAILLITTISPMTGLAQNETPETNLRLLHSDLETIQKEIKDEGTSVTLRVDAANDYPDEYPITYQWSFAPAGFNQTSVPIEGATDATYVIESFSPETAGTYECAVSDGIMMIPYTVNITFNTAIQWTEFQEVYSAELGESVQIQAKAQSTLGDIQYKWYKWSEADQTFNLYSSDSMLAIESVKKEDYGYWYCEATDGYGWISNTFNLAPNTEFHMDITEFTVVDGETLTIQGNASVSKLSEENDRLSLAWAKYEPYQDEAGNWQEGINDLWLIAEQEGDGTDWGTILDGRAKAGLSETQTEDRITSDFWITITDISDVWEGKFAIGAEDGYGNSHRFDFTISIGEYAQATLTGKDGVELEGVLHPAAKLEITTLENEQDARFQAKLSEREKIIWEQDVSLRIQGIADKYKGEMTLSIPVAEKYNGRQLKILHGLGDKIEVLYGSVEDGMLIFQTNSLSPFAVVTSAETVSESGNTIDNKPSSKPEDSKDQGTTVQINEGDQDKKADELKESPKTGDNGLPIWIPILLMIASGSLIALLVYKRKVHKA